MLYYSAYMQKNNEMQSKENDLRCSVVIEKRRSHRKFTDARITRCDIEKIITAGTRAPSGKNGQPWKFIVIQNNKDILKTAAGLTIYKAFAETADCLILVYLDKTISYNHLKDVQAIGACIQNMLLQATELGIGSCWIGEILNRADQMRELLGTPESLELMAMVALGYSGDEKDSTPKKALASSLMEYL